MKEEIHLPKSVEKELKNHLKSKKPLFGTDSPFSSLLQKMVNTMLEEEIEAHIATDKKSGKRNKRNGYNHKKVISEEGPIYVSTPRDRDGSFEPEIIGKRDRQL